MSASTNLIGDAKTVYTNGPTAATLAKAIAAAGPILDYPGQTNQLVLKLEDADVNLLNLLNVIDGSDGIKAGLTSVQHALAGLSAPSGTVITAMKTAIASGPSAATLANAIAAAGRIMDFPGLMVTILTTLEECSYVIGYLLTDTDSGDSTNKTLLTNIQTALS